MAQHKKVLVSVINNISTDQRVEKVCNSLFKNGYEILIIGTNYNGMPPLNRPYFTQRFKLIFQKKFLLFAEFNCKLFVKLLFQSDKNTLLLANDLDTLLPNYLVSKIKKIPLVFDSHEIYSELPSIQGRFAQKVWRKLEKYLIPRVKHFYTVSEGYADFFEKKYGNRPLVIKNVPLLNIASCKEKKRTIDLPENTQNKKILLYQGAINSCRGIDKMIEAINFIENAQLWIIGNGPLKKDYEKLCIKLQVENKVYFFGEIPPKQLRQITPMADLGLSLEEDGGLSYRYALPNKLFDYIHAKIPILGTYLPEIKNIINENQIGEVISDHSAFEISEKIKFLISKGKKYYLTNLEKTSVKYNWEAQEIILLNIFHQASK
ncbi:Glycosyltransferase involved in cell wall bisynthesis [Apibacter mensalis]|uniref:Glycosyltransferase involved in cell wall bisynthesis n=1 Tax=Apibacter mensalis TaxID=1586267 RepID=A0A0X3ANA3_9FLAO|nr:glycosyltransferase [Apibacter mensalis]CVK15713.1 Glycosyltransferase involved in cell wall bisynthesis [Apibacter mensalis]